MIGLASHIEYSKNEATARPIVYCLMGEINRGACFPSIIHQSIQLFDEFSNNTIVSPLLWAAAPSTYQTIFMTAISSDSSLEIPSELYLFYLGSEGEWLACWWVLEHAKQLIDNGLLDMLSVALRKPQTEDNSVHLLRILYRLCQYSRWNELLSSRIVSSVVS